MAEIGLDSRRQWRGRPGASRSTAQVRGRVRRPAAPGRSCSHGPTNGIAAAYEVDDWDFGLTDRDRGPKPALAAVAAAFAEVPLPGDRRLAADLGGGLHLQRRARRSATACERLAALRLPRLRGDRGRRRLDRRHRCDRRRVRRTRDQHGQSRPQRGSEQRAATAATGEIVAYIDDDAWPDPHWLAYLRRRLPTHRARRRRRAEHSTARRRPDRRLRRQRPGRPDPRAPDPTREAEHIPGCNMAFRRDALEAIGGFDPRFRAAGDDVDVCWRLQERGWTLGFTPGAVVWHHRRGSIRGYWRQQRGYGKAEALLERKWPERYNRLGHVTWPGQLYGSGARPGPLSLASIYGGTWGSAPYQSHLRDGIPVRWRHRSCPSGGWAPPASARSDRSDGRGHRSWSPSHWPCDGECVPARRPGDRAGRRRPAQRHADDASSGGEPPGGPDPRAVHSAAPGAPSPGG